MFHQTVVCHDTRFVSVRSKTKYFLPAETLTRYWRGWGHRMIARRRVVSVIYRGRVSRRRRCVRYILRPRWPCESKFGYRFLSNNNTTFYGARQQSLSPYVFCSLVLDRSRELQRRRRRRQPPRSMATTLFAKHDGDARPSPFLVNRNHVYTPQRNGSYIVCVQCA